MKIKIFSVLCVGLFLSLLMASIHNTFLLAGGSEVLDVNEIPSPATQIITVTLFLAFALVVVVFGAKLSNGQYLSVIFILLICFLLIIVSGHTFTISGKKHAMLDKWYHLTLQELPFDPNGDFGAMHYRETSFGVIISNENSEIFILTFPRFVGTKKDEVIRVIEDFGVQKKITEKPLGN
ncbi:hypothetical protein ACJJI4_09225 [Microbulbifer sp. TRSA002]|uniref:hypothetical protein n=1 Tax=Microbulbifer sp. TRSA002 TaxID=3243382 RepID=UPI0040398B31